MGTPFTSRPYFDQEMFGWRPLSPPSFWYCGSLVYRRDADGFWAPWVDLLDHSNFKDPMLYDPRPCCLAASLRDGDSMATTLPLMPKVCLPIPAKVVCRCCTRCHLHAQPEIDVLAGWADVRIPPTGNSRPALSRSTSVQPTACRAQRRAAQQRGAHIHLDILRTTAMSRTAPRSCAAHSLKSNDTQRTSSPPMRPGAHSVFGLPRVVHYTAPRCCAAHTYISQIVVHAPIGVDAVHSAAQLRGAVLKSTFCPM